MTQTASLSKSCHDNGNLMSQVAFLWVFHGYCKRSRKHAISKTICLVRVITNALKEVDGIFSQ
jgi:hypothetical protein